jgi:hypothetical protein
MARRRNLERETATTAHHEAAHAVVAFRLNRHVVYARVELDRASLKEGELAGVVRHAPYGRDIADDIAEESIVVAFAGPHGQAKFEGRNPRWGFATLLRNRNDFDDAREILKEEREEGELSGAAMDAYLRFCWTVARDMVEKFWPEIQAVAAALLKKGTLNHDEVVEAITGSPVISERSK